MRQKIVKKIRISQIKPLPIITFDNSDFNQFLFEPVIQKARICNKQKTLRDCNILKLSAAYSNSVCLTASQVGISNSLFVVNQKIEIDENNNNKIKWINNQYKKVQTYKIFNSAKILSGKDIQLNYQESISIPFIYFNVKRYQNIEVQYRNQLFQQKKQIFNGLYSRIIQQCLDFMNGIMLFDWRVHHGQIYFQQQMIKYFPKSSSIIQQFSQDIKKIVDEYPQLTIVPNQINAKNQRFTQIQKQILPFQSDFYRRLLKHYSKQMIALCQKIQKNDLTDPVWPNINVKQTIIK